MPHPKVTAAGLTPLAAAVIVYALSIIGVDIPQEIALGLAGGALAAFGGGWLKKAPPVVIVDPVLPPPAPAV